MNILSFKQIISKALTILLGFSVYGCSQLPSEVIVSPTIFTQNTQNYHHKTASLKVTDRRNNIHILQIMKDNKAIALINSQKTLAEVINIQLSDSYTKSFLTLSDKAPTNNTLPVNINVFIDTALINVEQDTFDYSSTNVLNVQVQMTKGNVTLTKTFKQKSASKGPMEADFAVLERDFSQQLSNTIQNILSDKELQDFINS